MTPDAWRAQGDVFDWRGEPTFFRAEGRGEPVVLIHGVPTASWDWAPRWPALVERCPRGARAARACNVIVQAMPWVLRIL